MHFYGHVRFHAVGQGLFSSAEVHTDGISKPLTWVYDCGTSSAGADLHSQVDDLSKTFSNSSHVRPKLDVLTISHFDKDHISGISHLLGQFAVGVLLLPFLPIWHRIFLAISQGIPLSDARLLFFTNPVAYLTGLDGSAIDRIIFVPPSGSESSPGEGEKEVPNPEPLNLQESWTLVVETTSPSEGDAKDFGALSAAQPGPRVDMLRPNGKLTAGGVWEFLPYNDAAVAPISRSAIRFRAAELGQELLRGSTEAEREESLMRLKQLYDEQFGRSGPSRNAISLFLYTGVNDNRREFCSEARLSHHPETRRYAVHDCPARKAGILYTGDGYLHKPRRLKRLLSFLGQNRTSGLNCVQVMHHGSKGNWHKGVGPSLAPFFSVFSSDPAHRGFNHPHPEVFSDFAPFGPAHSSLKQEVLVDFWIG